MCIRDSSYVAFNLLPSDPFDLLASCIVSLTQRINKYVCNKFCQAMIYNLHQIVAWRGAIFQWTCALILGEMFSRHLEFLRQRRVGERNKSLPRGWALYQLRSNMAAPWIIISNFHSTLTKRNKKEKRSLPYMILFLVLLLTPVGAIVRMKFLN